MNFLVILDIVREFNDDFVVFSKILWDLSDLSNQNGGYKRNTHDSSELSRLGTRSSRTYTRYMFCTGGKMICSVIWVKQ